MPIHNFKSILLILVVTVCTLAALPALLAAPQLDLRSPLPGEAGGTSLGFLQGTTFAFGCSSGRPVMPLAVFR
jgi:hypothetical protein